MGKKVKKLRDKFYTKELTLNKDRGYWSKVKFLTWPKPTVFIAQRPEKRE